jgi:undecaprenyl-diphosphatase
LDILTSILFGIVEGFTEFLPVSSTGHLILLSTLFDIPQSSFHKTYEVVIQLGSILAVVALYRDDIFKIEMMKKLTVAFIPTGILGFLFYKIIKSLFDSHIVAYMLIIGGIVFLIVEFFYKDSKKHIDKLENISYKKAFLIGLFQSLSMVPGTSRSGATIIGGLFLGLNRETAAKFSFLLAVPTMLAASVYDLYKHQDTLDFSNFLVLLFGFVTSFLFAMIAIKLFIRILTKYGFAPFGVYRIIIGAMFLMFII